MLEETSEDALRLLLRERPLTPQQHHLHARASSSTASAPATPSAQGEPSPLFAGDPLTSISFGQNLSSVINNPKQENSLYEWIDWIYDANEDKKEPIVVKPVTVEDVSLSHFDDYISRFTKMYSLYAACQKKLKSYRIPKDEYAAFSASDPVKMVTEKEGVPLYFFDETFTLSNPHYFQQVLGPQAIKTSLLLQEKLTHYLDKVEVTLLQQVSITASQCLDALMKYSEFHKEMVQSAPCIQDLRKKVQHLHEVSVKQPMLVNKLIRRRQNLMKLYQKMNLIAAVEHSHETIQQLLEQNNYIKAIEVIESTKRVVQLELSDIVYLQEIPRQFTSMLETIKHNLQDGFLKILLQSTVNLDDVGANVETHSKLFDAVLSLMKLNYLETSVEIYNECIAAQIKENLSQAIDSALSRFDIKVEEITSNMLQLTQVRSLNTDQFMSFTTAFIETIYRNLLRVNYMHNLVIKYYGEQRTQQLISSVTNDTAIENGMFKIMENLSEVCHTRCSIIYSQRTEKDIKTLKREQIIEIMNRAFTFIKNCEKLIRNKRINALRSTLMSHGQVYLDEFHRKQMEQLKLLMHSEQWIPEDLIPTSYQEIVNSFLSVEQQAQTPVTNSVENLEIPPTPVSVTQPIVPSFDEPQTTSITLPAANNNEQTNNYLNVNGELFPISQSLLMMIKIVFDYNEMLNTEKFPFINPLDLSGRLFRLMSFFNTELRELILGAGAIQKANLPKITTKHLMLASENLHCLLHFIPLVKRNMESQLEQKQQQILSNFDVLIRDCAEHQNKLYEKILEIMTDSVEAVIEGQWMKHRWDEEGMKAPSEAVRNMIRTVRTILALLTQFLRTHKPILQKIATRIILLYFERMKKSMVILSQKITTNKGKLRLWDDITVFRKNVSQWNHCFNTQELDLTMLEQVYHQLLGDLPLLQQPQQQGTPSTPADK